MGNEGKFPIEITGDATSLVAASQQTNAALESNKIKLSELTPEQKASAQALGDMGKASEVAGNGAGEHASKIQFLGLKTGELKKLTRELSHEFPIAGMAARLMINPVVAGLTLAVMTFGAAKKALDDWNAKLDAAAAQNASHDFLPGIEAKKTALDQARASAEEFATALDNIGKAEDTFKTKVAQAIDKLHEFTNAQAEVNSAGEAKELAEVDLKQKSGKLSEVGAIKERAAIRKHYREEQEKLKTQGENDEVGLMGDELAHDKASQNSLAYAAGEARRKHDELKARRAQAEKDLEEGKKKQEEYDASLAEALATKDEGGPSEGIVQSGEVPGELAINVTDDALAETIRKRDLQKLFNERTKGLIKSLDEQKLPEAEGASSVADTRAKSNAERINELERTLPGKKQSLAIRQGGREFAGAIKDETTDIETQATLAGMQRDLLKRVSDAMQHGSPLTPEDQKEVRDFATPKKPGGQMGAGDANELAAARAQVAKAEATAAKATQALIDHLAANKGLNDGTVTKVEQATKELKELSDRVRAIEGRPNRI